MENKLTIIDYANIAIAANDSIDLFDLIGKLISENPEVYKKICSNKEINEYIHNAEATIEQFLTLTLEIVNVNDLNSKMEETKKNSINGSKKEVENQKKMEKVSNRIIAGALTIIMILSGANLLRLIHNDKKNNIDDHPTEDKIIAAVNNNYNYDNERDLLYFENNREKVLEDMQEYEKMKKIEQTDILSDGGIKK